MSKQEVIAIVNPWFGRDRSPPIDHGATSGEIAAQVIADEMRGGGMDAYVAAIRPWIADRLELHRCRDHRRRVGPQSFVDLEARRQVAGLQRESVRRPVASNGAADRRPAG
jgi:hypothetical protein